MINHYLQIAQMVCLVLATFFILLQNRGVGLSSTFGGKDEIYLTRRGLEKTIVTMTVVMIAAFVVLRMINLFFINN
jgi:protein translocase SecG subunit